MITNLPQWINILFFIIFVATMALFYFSNNKPIKITLVILAWGTIHAVLAYQGFYLNTKTIPPRFALVFIPATLLIIYGCLPKQHNWIKKNRNLTTSTLLHTVRFPIEIVLFYLFAYKAVPEIMTFEGFNFDIIVGIAAPIIGFLAWKKKINTKILLLFNSVGLILVLTILVIALLSSELPFQQFGFEQPNKAINYFPFILLPACIVPIVIYTHITDIIKLKYILKTS